VVQLLVGLVPLLVVCAAVLVGLGVRLAAVERPLAGQTASARATVIATGQPPRGRGLRVRIDTPGGTRTGTVVLAAPADVPVGAALDVRYDPRSPAGDTSVSAAGDGPHSTASDLAFGLLVTAVVAVVAAALTALRLLSRRRLRGGPEHAATAGRAVVRQGLFVCSWLELVTDVGVRWMPVYW
jgi:hypothetical protein